MRTQIYIYIKQTVYTLYTVHYTLYIYIYMCSYKVSSKTLVPKSLMSKHIDNGKAFPDTQRKLPPNSHIYGLEAIVLHRPQPQNKRNRKYICLVSQPMILTIFKIVFGICTCTYFKAKTSLSLSLSLYIYIHIYISSVRQTSARVLENGP